MSFPTYAEFTSTPRPDLGPIPVGWDARRLKFCVSYNDESLPETTDPDFEIAYIDISSVDLVNGITTMETMADQLFFDQIQEEAIENDALQKAAATNTKDDFRYVFEKAFEGLVIDRMEGNEEIFSKLMGDGEFRKMALEHMLHKVYGALKKEKADALV